jgi:hypothetical protein
MSRSSRAEEAKAIIDEYYSLNGVMPTVQDFATAMGYSSTSSAHHVLSQLFEEGYLEREAAGGRMLPGPRLLRMARGAAPDGTGVPRELLNTLPLGVQLRVLKVGEGFRDDDAIWPGDLLLLAPAHRSDLSDLFVLKRGTVLVTSNELKTGWAVYGVVVGQFRSYTKDSLP